MLGSAGKPEALYKRQPPPRRAGSPSPAPPRFAGEDHGFAGTLAGVGATAGAGLRAGFTSSVPASPLAW